MKSKNINDIEIKVNEKGVENEKGMNIKLDEADDSDFEDIK